MVFIVFYSNYLTTTGITQGRAPILSYNFGEIGVWIAFPISEVISSVVSYRIMNESLKKLT